jgi:DNA-binding NarL/FixJ family response regulator
MDLQILAVDPAPIALRGYDALLRSEPGLTLSSTAQTNAEALASVRSSSVDLVITELRFEKGGGLGLVRQLAAPAKGHNVLVVSHLEETVFGRRALQAGARGYLEKKATGDALLEAIRTVGDGQFYLSDALQNVVMNSYTGRASGTSTEELTDRELEVFNKIAAGLTTREIADRLHISVKTVQTHRANIMNKLDIETKEKLIRYAVVWSFDHTN